MIVNRIYEWARSEPKKPAVIWNNVQLNYASFARAIDMSRIFFEGQNLPIGKTAIVLVGNLLDAWLCVMSLRSLGLNTISLKSIAQMERLKLRDIACIVVTQIEKQDATLSADVIPGARVITVPRSLYADIHTGDIPVSLSDVSAPGGHILYTSGTTGTYKKVLFGGSKEDGRNAAQAHFRSFSRNTLYHGLSFPLWSGIGFKCSSAVWHTGGCVLLDQRSDAYKEFFRHKITYACLVPPVLKEILQLHQFSESPRSDLEIMIGGGFLTIGLAKETVDKLARNVSNCYASTELSTPAMQSRYGTMDDLHWLSPDNDITIQIVDESGNECPTGHEGEVRILLRDIDCTSYLDDEAASEKVFRDGFFYPGDRAVKRADGRVRILGRTADVLNLQGEKIAVAPLEQRIQRQLQVDEVCLFSRLNDHGKEELAICIQSNHEPSRSQLDAIARSFKSVEQVRFSVLKEFPRTETGMRKVRRTELRKLVFGDVTNPDKDIQ